MKGFYSRILWKQFCLCCSWCPLCREKWKKFHRILFPKLFHTFMCSFRNKYILKRNEWCHHVCKAKRMSLSLPRMKSSGGWAGVCHLLYFSGHIQPCFIQNAEAGFIYLFYVIAIHLWNLWLYVYFITEVHKHIEYICPSSIFAAISAEVRMKLIGLISPELSIKSNYSSVLYGVRLPPYLKPQWRNSANDDDRSGWTVYYSIERMALQVSIPPPLLCVALS